MGAWFMLYMSVVLAAANAYYVYTEHSITNLVLVVLLILCAAFWTQRVRNKY